MKNRFFLPTLILVLMTATALSISCGHKSASGHSTGGNDDDSSIDDDSDDDSTDDDSTADDDADPRYFAVEVTDVEYGEQAGWGQSHFPDNVLGPPAGLGADAQQMKETEVLSLGHGGRITLRVGFEIVDQDGPDFTVFENAFYVGGDPVNCYTETAAVEVSQDGKNWVRFPMDYRPDGAGPVVYANPANFSGFAGVTPVYANSDGGADPLDPAVSGGDSFDLADVGLAWAKYIRIIDTGSAVRAPGTEMYDDNGDLIDDSGNHSPPSGNKEGFDLDAVAVIHAGDPT